MGTYDDAPLAGTYDDAPIVKPEEPKEPSLIEKLSPKSLWGNVVKPSIESTMKLAPFVVAPEMSIAKGFLPGLLSAAKFGLKSGGIIGGAKAIEKMVNNEPVQGAINPGLEAAALGAGLGVAAKPAGWAFKQSMNMAKRLSSVNVNKIDYAIEHPDIFQNENTGYLPVIGDIKEKLAAKVDEAHQIFDAGLKNMIDSVGNVKVKTTGVRSIIQKMNLDPEKFANKLNDYATNKELYKLSSYSSTAKADVPDYLSKLGLQSKKMTVTETPFDRLIKGKDITLEDARVINATLGYISRPSEAIGSGFIGKASKIKKQLLANMERAMPGLKDLNRGYAESIRFNDDIERIVGNDANAESTIKRIGEQLLTKKGAKSYDINRLMELDPYLLEKIKIANVLEGFSSGGKAGSAGFFKNAPFYMGGGVLGNMVGGPAGGVAGTALGGLVGQQMESPESTRKIIEFLASKKNVGRNISSILKTGAERIPALISLQDGE